MSLEEIQQALIDAANRRIRAGELTERGLARLSGLSQPHLHNSLKRVRTLSTEAADRLMRALQLTTEDLLWAAAGGGTIRVRTVPLVRSRIGPGYGADLAQTRGALPFVSTLVDSLTQPLAAHLAPDLAMTRTLRAHDLVLLDQDAAARTNVRGSAAWVVSTGGGLLIRYLQKGGGKGGAVLYVADETNLKDPARWQAIALARRNILDVVRARIVWFGRQIQEEPSGSAEPAGFAD